MDAGDAAGWTEWSCYHPAQGSTVPETATEELAPGEVFPTTSLDRKLERKRVAS